MYIDDLDRCTDGKSVEILEAVQLLFNETAPGSSSAGLLTEHGGWRVLCAKAACSWLRIKAWVGSCCRSGATLDEGYAIRDPRSQADPAATQDEEVTPEHAVFANRKFQFMPRKPAEVHAPTPLDKTAESFGHGSPAKSESKRRVIFLFSRTFFFALF